MSEGLYGEIIVLILVFLIPGLLLTIHKLQRKKPEKNASKDGKNE